ncbi:hypothetical protein B1C78_04975 [Thioalkalivibrio denitrificans]|uniref:Uncharacterized protein n=1 Tax=Thioalkalivibrio denitrificans TaxID=108003 RepID=A0A1V3NNW5_9GAMM|nr:hypothetical protein B1C78_04975 [Thioalkalivibrio denitrificans]
MKDSAGTQKIDEWSEVDQYYVSSAPRLPLGGCHGDEDGHVFEELGRIVEEVTGLNRKDGKPLSLATSGCDIESRLHSVALLRCTITT